MSASGRTSTSTLNRASFGQLLTLSRFRQGSEPQSPRHGSPGALSKANSFVESREALIIPERQEGDTPGKYLERLEEAVSRSLIAGILSKSADPFAQAVLRSYTRRFPFFGEPIDMSLRKFLLEAELPKETQQVDRVIQAFADRYHECNPGIFIGPDQAYVIAFSIMMLHTDAFNKNNKRKMQKQDYIKNTSGQGLSDDILACFYDNICYTPFVHYDEEDVDIAGDKGFPFSNKSGEQRKLKSAIPGADNAISKKPAGPIDPYNLLVDQKLDTLRPPIKESMTLEDPYHFSRTPAEIDMEYLQRAFTHTGHLQIISARSRPAAYENHQNNSHPNETETQQGIVDLKITKVGVLWRKSTKKKKTRSPWSEWGAVLTGSQLYLFKNVHWAKGLLHQFTSHQRPGQSRRPVVFKPPLTDFKPDSLLKIDHAVALVDSTYTRHKHAFTFVRMNGQEEVFLADNESELNDWLGLINYAAAFRAAGVRIRGMIGNIDEAQAKASQQSSEKQLEGADGETQPETDAVLTESIVTLNRGLSPQLHRQVMAARRQIIVQKMSEIEIELADANQRLDGLLRNGRHLLVLAPIPPKSREDIVHAAARTNASLTWLRRDIWRLKAQKEFLSLDLRLDGLANDESETLAVVSRSSTLQKARQQPQRNGQEPLATEDVEKVDTSKDAREPSDGHLSRQLSVQTSDARTQPERPTLVPRFSSYQDASSLATQNSQQPSATARSTSIDDWMTSDVFRTSAETTLSTPTRDGVWQLPPLNLESDSLFEHRKVNSVISDSQHSASPPGPPASDGKPLPAPPSIVRTPSRVTTDATGSPQSVRPTISSFEAREVERLARAALSPETTPPPSVNQAPSSGASPADTLTNASATRPQHQSRLSTSGVRRSLHKTLRDPHVHNSAHKHRRGRDSDSTLRSGAQGSNASATTTSDDKEADGESDAVVKAAATAVSASQTSTPGLARDKPRFILHGKQASVVQFGGDWERMRLRREAYGRDQDRDSLASSTATSAAAVAVAVAATEGKDHDNRAGSLRAPSLSVRSSTHDDRSISGASSDGLREDAELAATFATAAAATTSENVNEDDAAEEQYFDSWTGSPTGSNGATTSKRQTVLGPMSPLQRPETAKRSTPQDGKSSSDSDTDSDDEAEPALQRPRTASSSVHPLHLSTAPAESNVARQRSAQHDDDEDEDDEEDSDEDEDEDDDDNDDDDDDDQLMTTPIDDMELWRLSQV
jgi:hypothetical protein